MPFHRVAQDLGLILIYSFKKFSVISQESLTLENENCTFPVFSSLRGQCDDCSVFISTKFGTKFPSSFQSLRFHQQLRNEIPEVRSELMKFTTNFTDRLSKVL